MSKRGRRLDYLCSQCIKGPIAFSLAVQSVCCIDMHNFKGIQLTGNWVMLVPRPVLCLTNCIYHYLVMTYHHLSAFNEVVSIYWPSSVCSTLLLQHKRWMYTASRTSVTIWRVHWFVLPSVTKLTVLESSKWSVSSSVHWNRDTCSIYCSSWELRNAHPIILLALWQSFSSNISVYKCYFLEVRDR
jgi:hypothetical protein